MNFRDFFLGFFFESGKYLIGGIINTLVTYVMYLLLLTSFPRSFAFGIAFFLGIAFSYFWNRHVVFSQFNSSKTWFHFLPVPLGQLILSILIIELAVQLGVHETLAGILAIVILAPLAFILTRYILRRKN